MTSKSCTHKLYLKTMTKTQLAKGTTFSGRVHVSSLPEDISEKEIVSTFQNLGYTVRGVRIITRSNKSKYAFVSFTRFQDAEAVVKKAKADRGIRLRDRTVCVNPAYKKDPLSLVPSLPTQSAPVKQVCAQMLQQPYAYHQLRYAPAYPTTFCYTDYNKAAVTSPSPMYVIYDGAYPTVQTPYQNYQLPYPTAAQIFSHASFPHQTQPAIPLFMGMG